MPALQVKDFPADLYDELRILAADQDRSISQQTVHIIREYLRAVSAAEEEGSRDGLSSAGPLTRNPMVVEFLGASNRNAHRRSRVLAAIHELPKIDVPNDFPDPADLVAQMRNERDDSFPVRLGDRR